MKCFNSFRRITILKYIIVLQWCSSFIIYRSTSDLYIYLLFCSIYTHKTKVPITYYYQRSSRIKIEDKVIRSYLIASFQDRYYSLHTPICI